MLDTNFANLIKGIPANNDKWCERMAEGKLDANEHKKLKEWVFNVTDENILSKEELDKGGETISQK